MIDEIDDDFIMKLTQELKQIGVDENETKNKVLELYNLIASLSDDEYNNLLTKISVENKEIISSLRNFFLWLKTLMN
jgi:hypothetical protein